MAGEVGALRITLGINSGGVTQELAQVNRRLNALNQEFRAVSTGAARFDNSLVTLRTRSDVLSRTMTTHRTKVEELRRKYEESKATKGEDAAETLELAAAYNRAVAAMNRTEEQLTNVNRRIQEQTSEFGQLSQAVNQNVSDITRELRLLESGFNASSAGIEGFGSEVDQLRVQQDHLTQTFSLQQRRVEELSRLHRASADATGENSQQTQELAIRLNGAMQAMRETERRLNDTTHSIEEQTNVWNRLRARVNEAGGEIQETGRGIQGVGTSMSTTLTPAIAGIGAALGKVAIDAESSQSRLQALLGLTEEEAKKLGSTVRDIWDDGFGESLEEVEKGLVQVKNNLKDLNDDEIKQVTKDSIVLADVFESEVNEVTRAGSNIIKAFGTDSKKAFDLMAFGAQNGLNFSNEMFDNLSEYAPLFGKMGFSADEYFQLLIKGSKAGVYNLDYINDLMKENQIRLKDGSKATSDAMGQLSGSTQKVWKDMLAGKATVKDVHNVVIQDLKSMDNQTKANNIAVALYGTKFEDLEGDAVYSLGNIDGKLQDVDGSMKNATQSIEEAFGTRAKKAWREAQSALLPLGETLLDVAEDVLPTVSDTVQDVTNAFEKMDPEMQKTILAIGGVTAIAGPAVYTIGMLTTGAGALLGAVTPLISSIGAGGLAGGLAALTGPVGLTVAGLGLATGAVFALKGAMDESKEVNLEHANSLLSQQQSLEDLTGKYEALREKNNLANYELLRFRDIQDELKIAKSAEEISKLKDEAAKLQKESGLSNEELSEMLRLNDDLIKKAPEAGEAFSKQGNSIINNTEDLHDANAALRENLQLEIDIQRTKLEAKLNDNIEKQTEAQRELNSAIIEHNNNMVEVAATEFKIGELRKLQSEEFSSVRESAIRLLEEELDRQNKNVVASADQVQKKKESNDEVEKEIVQTQALYDEMINLQLAQAGINEKGQKGVSQLDQAISKTSSQISELRKVEKAQGGLNEAQKKELNHLNGALERYGQAQSEIRGIQSEQETVNSKIKKGKDEAGEMSNRLSKSETKNIKFTGNGYSDAKIISDETSRSTMKKVSVTDYGKAKSIHDTASKGATKTISIGAVVKSTFTSAIKAFETMSGINIPGFKTGTRYAPPGMAWIGEEGPELMYVPGGSRIIPNPQSEQILRSWNVPVNTRSQSNGSSSMTTPQSNRQMQSNDVRQNINIKPAPVILDGREVASIIFEPVKEMIDFNTGRKANFEGS